MLKRPLNWNEINTISPKNLLKKIFSLGLTGTIISCSGGGGGGSGTTSGGSTLSEYAALIGEEMVLSSPTAQRSSSRASSFSDMHPLGALDSTADADTKKEALSELLKESTTACQIQINLANSARANCYGPSVSYTGHEADASNGSWPGGDLGIWESSSASGEACVADQLNNQMKGVVSLVDLGQFMGAGIACVAKVNDLTLPTAGNSLDLTSSMSGIVNVNGSSMTVSSASIARESDVGGFPSYITTLNGTAGTRTINLRIKHIATSSDESTYRGKISLKVSNTSPTATDGVSLEYEKPSSSSVKFVLKKINFNSAGQDPFVSGSNYTVSYAKSWNNNGEYMTGEFNPTTMLGKYSYAWQAGNGDSHSRVLNMILSERGGSTTGTGFFGFGPTMQSGPGSISGMICAWTGPDQTHTPVSKVQRQNLSLTSNKFVLSGTSYSVFDPVADCEADGSMSMTWGSNTVVVSSTTENLRPLSEVSSVIGTLPTAPTDVD